MTLDQKSHHAAINASKFIAYTYISLGLAVAHYITCHASLYIMPYIYIYIVIYYVIQYVMPRWAEPRSHTVVGLCVSVWSVRPSVGLSVCLSAGFLVAR